jgi:hypothetical protein
MWTIERLSQHLPVLTCKVLINFGIVIRNFAGKKARKAHFNK